MPVLVTGASGFVGLNVCEALLGRGVEVVAYDAEAVPESARRAFASLPGTVQEIVGDVRDDAALNRLFENFAIDRVWHGAAVTGAYDREREAGRTILDVNVMGTHAVLEAARRRGVRRIVYASSTSVYGESQYRDAEMDEEKTPPVPDAIYGITKYAGERLSLRYRTMWDMDVVSARIGAVFGPWERDTGYRDLLSSFFQLACLAVEGKEAILPRRDLRRDRVYARNVADGLVALLFAESPTFEVYNLASGFAVGSGEWCARLKARYPAFTYRVAASGEKANVDHHETRNRAPQSIRRMAEDICFRPRFSFEEALDDYCDWIERAADFRNP
ncbi:MAG: NAD(P)-dependent oxidoreductase [Rhodospirillales bacterium]|jgi:UDP-glucuronate 4-epimerase|nr:NAD(P)-dependent oxidoreductase [Rhodospirillales bacterium]